MTDMIRHSTSESDLYYRYSVFDFTDLLTPESLDLLHDFHVRTRISDLLPAQAVIHLLPLVRQLTSTLQSDHPLAVRCRAHPHLMKQVAVAAQQSLSWLMTCSADGLFMYGGDPQEGRLIPRNRVFVGMCHRYSGPYLLPRPANKASTDELVYRVNISLLESRNNSPHFRPYDWNDEYRRWDSGPVAWRAPDLFKADSSRIVAHAYRFDYYV